MKTQILLIHGAMAFKNKKGYLNWIKKRKISLEEKKSWSREYLKEKLGNNFVIIRPNMPLKENARYKEWKIHFERYFPYLKNNIILIGNSLGGMFLARYLSENKFPKKILSLYLIASPFDDNLPTEGLGGGFRLKSSLSKIEKQCEAIHLLYSKNDNVVPIYHAKKYKNKLKNAKLIVYKSKSGHFIVSKFPEIIKMIKKDAKKI